MSKKPGVKSIIANFGVFSAASETDDSRPLASSAQPVARVGAGVIGATQRTLSDIREERDRLQALVASGGGLELDPSLIDPSPFPDRLPDDTDADYEAFKKLISDEGQKIPVQVRTHPSESGRYQIVYGHRRWRAARDLGLKIKAILHELTDSELAVAQGIENAARQDLSWIERALFAWRMEQAAVKARDIRAALGVDDAELARFRSVCRALPVEIIQAIGRAPKVGRPRWVELAMIAAGDQLAIDRIRETLSADKVSAPSSDDRFRRALASLKRPSETRAGEIALKSPEGIVFGRATFAGRDVKLTVEKSRADAFSAFLQGELPALIEKFFAQEPG